MQQPVPNHPGGVLHLKWYQLSKYRVESCNDYTPSDQKHAISWQFPHVSSCSTQQLSTNSKIRHDTINMNTAQCWFCQTVFKWQAIAVIKLNNMLKLRIDKRTDFISCDTVSIIPVGRVRGVCQHINNGMNKNKILLVIAKARSAPLMMAVSVEHGDKHLYSFQLKAVITRSK